MERDPVTQEMTTYPIRSFADIIRALEEHPEWRNRIRQIILTAEWEEVPKKLAELERRVRRIEEDVAVLKKDVAALKKDVAVLKKDVAALKKDVAVLKKDVAALKKDVEALKKDMNYLKGEFGRFKGKDFERSIRERFYAFFGHILRKAKKIDMEKVVELIDEAEEKGIIEEKERDQLLQLDLVVTGQLRKTHKQVHLAVEISYTLYPDDIKRAIERAVLLGKVLGKEIIPTVVAVEIGKEAAALAEQLVEQNEILLITTNY